MTSSSPKIQLSDGSSLIILPIKQIALTDAQLKLSLSDAYEEGVQDSTKWKWVKLGPVLLSIAGTLLVTCLTSKFNDFSAHVEWATHSFLMASAWVICVCAFLVGLALLVFSKKPANAMRQERNKAVEAIFNQHQGNPDQGR
jgi:hypothetical protein